LSSVCSAQNIVPIFDRPGIATCADGAGARFSGDKSGIAAYVNLAARTKRSDDRGSIITDPCVANFASPLRPKLITRSQCRPPREKQLPSRESVALWALFDVGGHDS
jgi:hypothetical protein